MKECEIEKKNMIQRERYAVRGKKRDREKNEILYAERKKCRK